MKPQLNVILGDQLNLDSHIFEGVSKAHDIFAMAELPAESQNVWSSKIRTTLFLSAMRHFSQTVSGLGYQLDYQKIDDLQYGDNFKDWLTNIVQHYQPAKIRLVLPGEWRIYQSFTAVCDTLAVPLEIIKDVHFYASINRFKQHAANRKTLRLEYWYRELRSEHQILMNGDKPLGNQWNFDQENRHALDHDGLRSLSSARTFMPDNITKEVILTVERLFADHPGTLKNFDWPVTREDALIALHDFIQHRLPNFGRYQDAMFDNEPYLFHSRLSAALNLKLLNPREVVNAALHAFAEKQVDLASVEGFVRQIIGWREFVRGYYWLNSPQLLSENYFSANQALPDFFWTANTELFCLHQALKQTLALGYAHHIQRLMVTGLFLQLLGVEPKQVHEWYLAVYVDAVEWVEAPNTLGMSQYADGGKMSSKPYVASGAYIQKMSNYCQHCKFEPKQRVGEKACPITNLYWDFLFTHQEKLAKNPRMTMQLKHLEKISSDEKNNIQTQAAHFRAALAAKK